VSRARASTTTNRQEKADKANKKAKKKADEIVDKAVAAAVTKAATPKRGGLKPGEDDLAAQVKELRDGGMAWWAVGQALGLKGAGDSATTGKGGAAQARRLYAAVNGGSYPRKQRMRKPADETLNGVQGSRKGDVVKATPGEPMFDKSTMDEEVIDALKGKRIEWDMYVYNPQTGQHDHYAGRNDAIVHPKMSITIDDARDQDGINMGDRIVNFREAQGNDVPLQYRGTPGAYRSVRLSRIVKVDGRTR
jgi:hypothetical protein